MVISVFIKGRTNQARFKNNIFILIRKHFLKVSASTGQVPIRLHRLSQVFKNNKYVKSQLSRLMHKIIGIVKMVK